VNDAEFAAVIRAPFGAIGIRTGPATVAAIVYLPPGTRPSAPANDLARRAAAQLARYLESPDIAFDLPLASRGTPFQRRVWDAIAAIPRGTVRTYGDIAKQLHTAAQAVGQACGANDFPIVIPCHRVTARGALGGFAHRAQDADFHSGVKRWLLEHEGASVAA
jgi:methylated-DNA-[protein]-cysteine S-methyltransferase